MSKFRVNDGSGRLDVFLVSRIQNSSRACMQRLISSGKVLVNGKSKSASYKVRKNDLICVSETFLDNPSDGLLPWNFPLEVVFEDDDYVVINKPAFLSVHPVPHSKKMTLVNALLYKYGNNLSSASDALRPGIVHRLDKDTSGCLIVSKNDAANRYFSEQFKKRSVKKVYVALLKGRLSPVSGMIKSPIGRSYKDHKKMSVHTFNGRDAVTHYKVVKYFDDCTLVEVNIITGRTHQIRVHFSAIGYPIIGDDVYGDKKLNKVFKEKFGLCRQFLHARNISFNDPSGVSRSFEAPLPKDLENILTFL